MQPVEQLRSYGADIDPLDDRELCGLPASGTEREEPDVDELVVCVDAKLTACPEALGRANVAPATNERQAYGFDYPVFGHRKYTCSVRNSPQKEHVRIRDARQSALGRSHRVYNGTSLTRRLGSVAR
ncbi:hypothetical protein GCM10027521_25460 [Amycolatopsis cihanbeyliensis]